jgi:anti-sigma regulatory factor (Ser/Thr protein kinase)
MTNTHEHRILVCSQRAEIIAGVREAASTLVPTPSLQHGLDPEPDGCPSLAIVDVADPCVSASHLRQRLGSDAQIVALIESGWAHRLNEGLGTEWFDYLFFPINRAELGLVWQRHLADDEKPSLNLDVIEDGRIRLVCPSRVAHQRPAVERIVEACRHLGGLDDEASFRLRVAMGEAVANAILYGNEEDPTRFVTIEAEPHPHLVRVRIADEGTGFDPGSIPDPRGSTGVKRSRGRGLFLLRSLMDEVSFNDVGNEVTLVLRARASLGRRVGPLLESYAKLTGLEFHLAHRAGGEPEQLYASPSFEESSDPTETGGAPVSRSHILSAGKTLELLYLSGGAPTAEGSTDQAADFLLDWVTEILQTEAARELTTERRLGRERILAELEVARDLQLRLLPSLEEFSDLAQVAGRCGPALSLGGDFYCLTRLPYGQLGVMLGDVSSHGPSAALIMALTLSAAAVVTRGCELPGDVMALMHRQLLAALESTEMYMTLFYGVLDPRHRRLRYANAGHPFAFRARAGTLDRLGALDPPLGMTAPDQYGHREVEWETGTDTLLLFTDGLAEGLEDPTTGPRERLVPLLSRGDSDPEALVDALFGDPGGAHADDRTALAVRV